MRWKRKWLISKRKREKGDKGERYNEKKKMWKQKMKERGITERKKEEEKRRGIAEKKKEEKEEKMREKTERRRKKIKREKESTAQKVHRPLRTHPLAEC